MQRTNEATLRANRNGDHPLGTIKQRYALRAMTEIDERDLVLLGVRLGRLDAQCAELAARPTPLAWLSRPETGGLFEMAREIRNMRRQKAAQARADQQQQPENGRE